MHRRVFLCLPGVTYCGSECVNLFDAQIFVADYIEKPFSFELHTPMVTLFLSAVDEDERMDWIRHLINVGVKWRSSVPQTVVLRAPVRTGEGWHGLPRRGI